MCGILGTYAKDMSFEVIRNLYNIFHEQQSRGLQGGGLLVKTEKEIGRFRSKDPFKIFSGDCVELWDKAIDNSIILFHHRYPTSTKNKWHCNHPIANEDRSIFLIHNGHISIEYELKAKHKFETTDGKEFTDSEIAVHLLEENLIEMDRTESLIKLSEKLGHGFSAAIVFKDEHKIYLIKNGYPIKISKFAGNTYFSSELHDAKYQLIKEMKDGEVGYIDDKGYTMLKEGKDYHYVGHYTNWEWNGYYRTLYKEPKETIQRLFTKKQRKRIIEIMGANHNELDREDLLNYLYYITSRDFQINKKHEYIKVISELEQIYNEVYQ